jgi:aspartyl-tRNA(Asn)/glutamyl-tRNA(Gln) amidotransferase subunit A
LCAVALGTDTLGSVRIPAAYNGVYGLKPTNDLVPDDGLVALAHQLDCIGPLARSVEDLAAVMAVLAPLQPGGAVARVATLVAVDESEQQVAVRQGFLDAVAGLRELGCEVNQVSTPLLDLTAARMGGFVEAARAAAAIFADDRAAGGISKGFAALMDFGVGASSAAVAKGVEAMAQARNTLNELLIDADVLLLPTAPQAAFPHGRAPVTQADFTGLANIAGLPALSLPAGVDVDGLPVGVQIVGRAGSEATLLALAGRMDAILRGYRTPPSFA